jgi:hypothetical protein
VPRLIPIALVLVGCSSLSDPDGWFWSGKWSQEEKTAIARGASDGCPGRHPASDQSYPYSRWDDLVIRADGAPWVWGYRANTEVGDWLYISRLYPGQTDGETDLTWLRWAGREGFRVLCEEPHAE